MTAGDADDTSIARVVDRLELYRPIIEGGGPFSDEQPRSVDALVGPLLCPAPEMRHVPHVVGREELGEEVTVRLTVL